MLQSLIDNRRSHGKDARTRSTYLSLLDHAACLPIRARRPISPSPISHTLARIFPLASLLNRRRRPRWLGHDMQAGRPASREPSDMRATGQRRDHVNFS